MRNYLALDTSGDHLCVVAKKDGKVFSRFLPNATMKHSILWLKTVDEVLKEANLALADCDFFAAVVGAGSFTGIRIGISAMKGFASAYGKKTLPITSFDVIAYNALDGEGGKGKILALVDALHGAYYACGYQNGKVVLPPAYISEEEVISLEKEGYLLCGNGKLPVAERARVRAVDPVAGLVKAADCLSKAEAFAPLTAVYVRKSSAEINLCK